MQDDNSAIDSIAVVPMPSEPQLTVAARDRIRSYERASRAPATQQSYRQAARLFEAWCALHGHQALPAGAATVKALVTEMAAIGPDYRMLPILGGKTIDRRKATNAEPRPLKPASIAKLVSAIAFAHRRVGHPFDRQAIETGLAGIRRTHGVAPRQMKAITLEELRRIVDALPDNLQRWIIFVGGDQTNGRSDPEPGIDERSVASRRKVTVLI